MKFLILSLFVFMACTSVSTDLLFSQKLDYFHMTISTVCIHKDLESTSCIKHTQNLLQILFESNVLLNKEWELALKIYSVIFPLEIDKNSIDCL